MWLLDDILEEFEKLVFLLSLQSFSLFNELLIASSMLKVASGSKFVFREKSLTVVLLKYVTLPRLVDLTDTMITFYAIAYILSTIHN